MNNTPRTDKEAVIVNGMARAHLCEVWKEAVNADFARELERENAKLRGALQLADATLAELGACKTTAYRRVIADALLP